MRASTTHLLNTIERFDVLHVLERVPAHWPVHDLERFLVRALQQLQHNRRHLQVIKAAAHAENADMLTRHWRQTRYVLYSLLTATAPWAAFYRMPTLKTCSVMYRSPWMHLRLQKRGRLHFANKSF